MTEKRWRLAAAAATATAPAAGSVTLGQQSGGPRETITTCSAGIHGASGNKARTNRSVHNSNRVRISFPSSSSSSSFSPHYIFVTRCCRLTKERGTNLWGPTLRSISCFCGSGQRSRGICRNNPLGHYAFKLRRTSTVEREEGCFDRLLKRSQCVTARPP